MVCRLLTPNRLACFRVVHYMCSNIDLHCGVASQPNITNLLKQYFILGYEVYYFISLSCKIYISLTCYMTYNVLSNPISTASILHNVQSSIDSKQKMWQLYAQGTLIWIITFLGQIDIDMTRNKVCSIAFSNKEVQPHVTSSAPKVLLHPVDICSSNIADTI